MAPAVGKPHRRSTPRRRANARKTAASNRFRPAAALYGALDRAVDVTNDAPQLKADFKRAGMTDLTVKIYPGAGHSLFLSPTGYRDDTKPTWQLVPDYSTVTIDWLRARNFLKPASSPY